MEKTKIATTSGSERRKTYRALMGLIIAQAVLLVTGTQVWGAQIVKKVNCDKGQTITHALQGLDLIPITIRVRGTCNENVEIDRDDVTLIADPSGAMVKGDNPDLNTITVSGARTVIDGLRVTGGRHGIAVTGNSTIRNCTVENTRWNGIAFHPGGQGTVDHCTVQNAGRNGIAFVPGSFGTVDNCIVQNNPRDGILIDANGPIVINSTITLNTGHGIHVDQGGKAWIGFDNRFSGYAGNTISNNQANGILIVNGGSAQIGGNTIEENATFGIQISHGANALLLGENSITGNGGSGVFASFGSAVQIGNPFPDLLPATNVITGNGASFFNRGGIYAANGVSLYIRFATIDDNFGDGISLSNRSTAVLSDNTLNGNTGNGILLSQGASLVLQDPPVTVTGNALFGLQCVGTESSRSGNTSGISSVSPDCTGF